MGLFGKSKRRSKSEASTSQPPARDPPPQVEANYNNVGGGGYLNNSYSYRDYNEYYNNNPQSWPFDHRESDYHRGPPPGERLPPPQYYGYPYADHRPNQYYPPAPSWTPGPPDPLPPPPPAPTYFMPPPGRSIDDDPNAQCMIM